MASPEAIGTAACLCGERVYVAKNSGGFPYFRCGACGVEVRHHRHSASAKFIREKVTIFPTDEAPEAIEKPVKSDSAPPVAKPKSITATLLG